MPWRNWKRPRGDSLFLLVRIQKPSQHHSLGGNFAPGDSNLVMWMMQINAADVGHSVYHYSISLFCCFPKMDAMRGAVASRCWRAFVHAMPIQK